MWITLYIRRRTSVSQVYPFHEQINNTTSDTNVTGYELLPLQVYRHWYADTGKPILAPISPASRMQSAQLAGPKITLCFPRLCIRTYHMHNNYVLYIVAM